MAQLVKYSVLATIASAASLSSAIDLGEGRAALIQMPGDWTAGDLTLQVSVDGTTFWDLYDAEGNEYTIAAAADRTIMLPIADFLGVRHLKLRAGTTASPAAQGAERVLTIGVIG